MYILSIFYHIDKKHYLTELLYFLPTKFPQIRQGLLRFGQRESCKDMRDSCMIKTHRFFLESGKQKLNFQRRKTSKS